LENLSQSVLLNSTCDYEARGKIITIATDHLPPQQVFPLKPITLFLGGKKINTKSGPVLWFATQTEMI
jgi:hypothetical protein